AEHAWRTTQNWVGQTRSDFSEQVHFVCPKPEDVGPLMESWMRMATQLDAGDVDPVAAAAAVAFGFVFIHPFEDGNGRIHRFLIHYVLAKKNFTPQDIIFPISSIMLKKIHDYDAILESFSKPLLTILTKYHLTEGGMMTVQQESKS